MVTWEYNAISIWRPDHDIVECSRLFQMAAQELGKSGWEMVSVLHLQGGFQGFFKRAKFVSSNLKNGE